MIKRPFFVLTQPRLGYDSPEPDPKEPKPIPLPSKLILLLHDPIDSARETKIKTGDKVKKGEKLHLYSDSTEYTVSPAAGTIKSIDTYSDDFGNTSTYLVISTDPGLTNGTDALKYDLKDTIASADAYLRTLPGAPPLKTLADPSMNINTIVVTCTDPDLLSTTRQYVALKFMDEIKEGIQVLKQITSVSKFCLTIPGKLDIKTDISTAEVFRTSSVYPSNLPAMILKNHLNIVLPAGKKPEDLGICFMTAEAVVSLARAYKTKTAGHDKILTIIGKQGTPYRVTATIGTPLRRIFNAFSIQADEQDRIVVGGPMTGFAAYTVHHPVQPDMDTVIIQDKGMIPELSDNPCVNCGKCVRICPVNVPVNILVRYLEAGLYEDATDRYDLLSCIECGLCAYVCTARIPIYQYIRLGKHELLKLRSDV
ncbi:MAG: 4Fe-4S dicluster domain-containing protein [Desulfobacula sp.]|jgi:electron transport complex protein RnfC